MQKIPYVPGGGVDLSYLAQSGKQGGSGQAAAGFGAPAAATQAASGANSTEAAYGQGAAGAQSSTQPPATPVEVSSVIIRASDENWQSVIALSYTVPVFVHIFKETDSPSAKQSEQLAVAVRGSGGRLMLALADSHETEQMRAALAVRVEPTLYVLISGQAVPLTEGVIAESQIREITEKVIQLAESYGLTGRVSAPDLENVKEKENSDPLTNVREDLRPAIEAASAGDFAKAIEVYHEVLKRNPRDDEALAGLAQIELLERLDGKSAEEIRLAAGNNPQDRDAQMLVADLDLAGGHVEDAFLRLLDLFAASTEEDRQIVQKRLVDLFTVVGQQDPRVVAARRKLASLLY